MTSDEIKQKLIDNGFESLISIFEENHLLDENTLSRMTDADYQSIGISALGDRKKLMYLFSDNKVLNEEQEPQKKIEYVDIKRNGKEFCYRSDEPGILLCRKCHKRVSEDDTLCSNCNNSLISSTPNTTLSSYNNSNYYSSGKNKKANSQKTPLIITLIILAVVGITCFVNAKKNNYNNKMVDIYIRMVDSTDDIESCLKMVLSVWGNAIWKESDKVTDKYTRDPDTNKFVDFNTALNNLYGDKDFKTKITKIGRDRDEISLLMSNMPKPPKKYEDAYSQLESCYKDYTKFAIMAQKPSGSYTSFTSDVSNLDSSLSSELGALESYLVISDIAKDRLGSSFAHKAVKELMR